ncbi:MAG TPA: hypothetical protein VFB14_11915 [Bryobacteraceae bacterium]|jgi:hypothetical protein|nr:hypothetical protein [Bryobacteraceae bacterium]
MNDDYLWDRTGKPDAELVHLERVLGTLSWSNRQRKLQNRRIALRIAAAAIFLIVVGSAIFVYRVKTPSPAPWQLAISGEKPEPMHAGQVVETTGEMRGSIESQFVGKVDIEPDSRLRLLAASGDKQRLALDRGTIHALIWAPPAKFVVDTPSAKAVDLGCKYTLQVGKNGAGLLTVELGWVAFQWHRIESFIPAEAACRTRPGYGPGTPYFLDASPTFKNAITEFDAHGTERALRDVLAAARPRDGLTLWHLLQRTHEEERGEVFDQLAQLMPMPQGVTRDAILRGDKASMDAVWNALGLGDTGWWREWKREW